jgi:thiamine-phosphate diphosphorylase
VALAAGAHGVHLRAASFAGSRARAVVPRGFLIGRSVHDLAEVQAATADASLDYLLFGTVFASASKPGRTPVGVGALAAAVAATPLPVLAIGGITVDRLCDVRGAGASGWAAIGLFGGSPESMQLTLEESALSFDTSMARR